MIEEYAAGIIDGEGAIGVGNQKGSYRLLAQVSMKLPTQVPKWLYDNFGGHYGEYKQGKRALGSGYIAKWSIHGTEAQEFISYIRPFLLDKAELADIALVFPVAQRKGEREVDIQSAVYEKMREINHSECYLLRS